MEFNELVGQYVTAVPKEAADMAWGDYIETKTPVEKEDYATGTLTRQVGGDHYKKQGVSMQPWAIIDAWKLDYYAGTVLKYLLRYPYKGGVEDLKKARHFLDRMIEKYDENPS